jgi:hypothetical protein
LATSAKAFCTAFHRDGSFAAGPGGLERAGKCAAVEQGLGRAGGKAIAESAAGIEQTRQRSAGKACQCGEIDLGKERRAGRADVGIGGAQLMFGGEHVGAAQQDGGIEPDRKAGENRVFPAEPGRQVVGRNRRPDKELQGIPGLGKVGHISGDIRAGTLHECVGLHRFETGADPLRFLWRDRQRCFAAGQSFAGDGKGLAVGPDGEPGIGDFSHQRDGRGLVAFVRARFRTRRA